MKIVGFEPKDNNIKLEDIYVDVYYDRHQKLYSLCLRDKNTQNILSDYQYARDKKEAQFTKAMMQDDIRNYLDDSYTLIESVNEELLDVPDYSIHKVYYYSSPYQVKDFLLSKNDTQRIYIDKEINMYLISNAFDIVHNAMINVAKGNYIVDMDYKWSDLNKSQIALLFVPNNDDTFNEWEDATSDSYDRKYVYNNFIIYSRYNDFDNFELANILGEHTSLKIKWTDSDENGHQEYIFEELQDKDTFTFPNLQKAIDFFWKDRDVKVEKVSIEQLVKDNDLLNDDDLQSYHQRQWDNKKANEFSINKDKINSMLMSEVPYVVRHKDGRLELGDGRHRTRALYNDGYKYVELPVIIENMSKTNRNALKNDFLCENDKSIDQEIKNENKGDFNIKEVYHCRAKKDFNREIKDRILWFSEDLLYSMNYGENIFTCNLSLHNPFDVGNTDLYIRDLIPTKFSKEFIDIANRLETTPEELLTFDSGAKRILSIVGTVKFGNLVKSKGYDGITSIEDGNKCYAVFNLDQVEVLDVDLGEKLNEEIEKNLTPEQMERLEELVNKNNDENSDYLKIVYGSKLVGDYMIVANVWIFDINEDREDDIITWYKSEFSQEDWNYILNGSSEELEEDLNTQEQKQLDEIDNLVNDLYKLRQQSIQQDGEFGVGNLVFKEMRNMGYLDNLKEIKRKLQSKDMSLEK